MEPPAIYSRWAGIVAVGAMLGRNVYFQHGHNKIHANTYCMLLGSSGTRKSTPIKLIKKLLTKADYTTIAADKSSKEKFLLDLMGEVDRSQEDKLASFLEADADTDLPKEMLVAADEWNDFMGLGNLEFISLLGSLWDYEGIYKSRLKNSKSPEIPNPTISILGGNTPTGFSLAFPAESLGQGFFSRILLIHGEPTGKRITFPKPPSEEDTLWLIKRLMEIRAFLRGPVNFAQDALDLVDKIYQTDPRVDDVRFESYSSRRLTHLVKLCVILAASRLSMEVSLDDVIAANTFLSAAEANMPKAMGEFGKAKNSDVTSNVMQVIEAAKTPVDVREIWSHVHQDLDDLKALATILNGLREAGKIQIVTSPDGNHSGFLPLKAVNRLSNKLAVDLSLLTAEERKGFS
jgi:energy-coupling factor transporter ATP-binding protein EcfA2